MTEDEKKLIEILDGNLDIALIFERAGELNAPNWYLGGGAVAQTVWNHLHGFAPTNGIKDYDLVYFDAGDLSKEAEERVIQAGEKLFANTAAPVEIVNEARVHLWYEEEFGHAVTPNKSVEDAIDRFPMIPTSLGIRYENDEHRIYAPFGVRTIFEMVLRPNKAQITEEMYRRKVERYASVWPKLTAIPWDEAK